MMTWKDGYYFNMQRDEVGRFFQTGKTEECQGESPPEVEH
jgi:hypothetical protein